MNVVFTPTGSDTHFTSVRRFQTVGMNDNAEMTKIQLPFLCPAVFVDFISLTNYSLIDLCRYILVWDGRVTAKVDLTVTEIYKRT